MIKKILKWIFDSMFWWHEKSSLMMSLDEFVKEQKKLEAKDKEQDDKR